jgi:excisionase family DNA binding protein
MQNDGRDSREDGGDYLRANAARKGSPFLNTAQAAHYLGLSERTLREMRGRGDGPPFREHGRQYRYHIDELDAWSLAHKGVS